MIKHILSIVIAGLLLASCDKPTPQKSASTGSEGAIVTFKVTDMNGTWAWMGQENCWGQGNFIKFETPLAENDYAISVHHFSDAAFDVSGATINVLKDSEGKPLITVTYVSEGRHYEEQYAPKSVNELRVYKSLVEGVEQRLTSTTDPTRVLVRCQSAPPVQKVAR